MATLKAILSRSRNCAPNKSKYLMSPRSCASRAGPEPPQDQQQQTSAELNSKDDDDEMEARRNKSRMPPRLWHLMRGIEPSVEEQIYHKPPWFRPSRDNVKYLRKYYARHGRSSGLQPGIMWPTPDELAKVKEFEERFYPPLKEMRAALEREETEALAVRTKREETILLNYAKLETWIKDLKQRSEKKQADADAQKRKKERLIEEVREYFGYRVSPNEEKFKTLLEQKEKEQKKAAKEVRKKEKIAKELARLTSMADKEVQQRKENQDADLTTEIRKKSELKS